MLITIYELLCGMGEHIKSEDQWSVNARLRIGKYLNTLITVVMSTVTCVYNLKQLLGSNVHMKFGKETDFRDKAIQTFRPAHRHI